jgi:hypothetical protein
MVGKTPNHAEKAIIVLIKYLGYKQGDIKKTGVRWNKRSIKRAFLDTGDFYSNCVWGSFKNPNGKPRLFEMDIAFPNSRWDIEIDLDLFHNVEKDKERDMILKYNGWIVTRITIDCVYSVFVPMLNEFIDRGRKRRFEN